MVNEVKIDNELGASDDLVASRVSWVPINTACANFKTQKITRNCDRIFISATIGLVIFSSIFFVIGLGACIIACIFLSDSNFSGAIFCGLFGALFCYGGMSSFLNRRDFVLDLSKGYYFFGSRYEPGLILPRSRQGLVAHIYAIQLLQKSWTCSDNYTHICHELNLVFKNAERVNIMTTSTFEDNQASAALLSEALGVPVWKGLRTSL